MTHLLLHQHPYSYRDSSLAKAKGVNLSIYRMAFVLRTIFFFTYFDAPKSKKRQHK